MRLVEQHIMVRSHGAQGYGLSRDNVYLRRCTSIQLLRVAGAKPYLLRALQAPLPGSHQWLPEVVLAIEVGVSYADECAGQMCLKMSASVVCEHDEVTYCVTKVDEGVPANDSNQVEQHDCGEKVLRFERDGHEQYPQLSSWVLHTESSKYTKQSTTGSTSSDEHFWNDSLVLRKHCRQMLCISGKYTGSEEERSDVRPVTLEQI